jgi:tRNA A37 threonylcarbamoyladenosine modification protein TsaB
MELKINTSDSEKTQISVKFKSNMYLKTVLGRSKAQQILPTIENILTENHIFFDTVNKIKVNTGPGSFTGLKVGIAVARTLGLLLGVRVNQKDPVENIDPKYTQSRFDK